MHEKFDDKILFKEECFNIQGAIFDVYKEIGNGFLEAVYHECLENEFFLRNIPFVSQAEISLWYKGKQLKQKYIPDFICHDKIIVEIKAVSHLTLIHKAQLLNYLKATSMKIGMLVNFGAYPKAEIIRMVN